MDRIFGASPVPGADVADSGGAVRLGGVDGCVGLRVGHSLRRSSSPGPLVGQARPSGAHQRQGVDGSPHLSRGVPASVDVAAEPLVADRQHDGDIVRPSSRWHTISSSPLSSDGDSPFRSRSRDQHSASIRAFGGESSGLASMSGRVSSDRRVMGSSGS